jgi:murein DD-endopeptidase MepM/ murein hydrolase activator NlpD
MALGDLFGPIRYANIFLSKKVFLVLLLVAQIQQAFCNDPSSYIDVDVDIAGATKDRANVRIANSDVFPRVVYLEIFNGSLKGNRVSSLLAEVGPKKNIRLVAVNNSSIPFSRSLAYKIFDTVATLEPKIKDNRLHIPFAFDVGYKICQSPDGPLTSHSIVRKNAIDFCADENTIILAAKSGVVIEVIQDFTQGGKNIALLGKENKIKVLHEDGLVSSYAHLAHKSAYVKVGDRVEQGQKLARVGNVGYSSGPHLHFELTQVIHQPNAEEQIYDVVPAVFIDKNDQAIQIRYGDIINSYDMRLNNKRLPSLPQRMF